MNNVVQQAIQPQWYQSLIVQLGAGGCFALILVCIFLRFIHKSKATQAIGPVKHAFEKEPTANANGNGMSYQDYMQTAVLPQIAKLQEGHESLIVLIAKLPTRGEQSTIHNQLHQRLSNHEDKCVNYKIRPN